MEKAIDHTVVNAFNKELRKWLLETVGKELAEKGFKIVDSSKFHLLYHKNSDSCIEMIQFSKGKYETYITVCTSIAFLNTNEEKSNIDYKCFNAFNNCDFRKISVDDCFNKCFLKGHFGNGFHYGDVYLALGRGIVGVSPNSTNKPFGLKLKKYKDSTYRELCGLIMKKIHKLYSWLEKQKKAVK